MSEETRASLIMGLWFLATLALIALFISAAILGEFAAWHIIFSTILLAIPIGATPLLLRYKSDESESEREKAKRERIDNMLRDMSDEDLLELKKRLSDGDFHDEQMLDYLSSDGELVLRD